MDDGGSLNPALKSNTITFTVNTRTASGVTLTHRALRRGLAASRSGWVTMALACPAKATGCDANGTMTVALRALGATIVPRPRSHVIARFHAIKITIGHARVISVRLTPAMLHSLQARHIRRIRVTLSIVNHYGHAAVTRIQHVWLRVPAAVQRHTAAAVCPGAGDGDRDRDADDSDPACLHLSIRMQGGLGHRAGLVF